MNQGGVAVAVLANDQGVGTLVAGRSLIETSVRAWRIWIRRGTARTGSVESKRGDEKTEVWEQGVAQPRDFFERFDTIFVLGSPSQVRYFKQDVLGSEEAPRVADLRRLCTLLLPDRRPELLVREWRGYPEFRLENAVEAAADVLMDIAQTARPSGRGDGARFLLDLVDQLGQQGDSDLLALSNALRSPSLPRPRRAPARSARTGFPDQPAAVRFFRERIVAALRASRRSFPKPDPKPRPVPEGAVEKAFEDLSGKDRPGRRPFQSRPQQLQYAQFVAQALGGGGTSVLEAGTGTGKTMGYLVAAGEFIRENPGWKVIIASSTRNLQNQILEELGCIRKIERYRHLTFISLKGRRNYLCTRALLNSYRRIFLEQEAEAEERLAWLHLCSRLVRQGAITEGARKHYQELPLLEKLLEEHRASVACYGKACKKSRRCLYHRLVSVAKNVDVVVTNHHKLFHLPETFQRCAVCIIDEADAFPASARSSRRTTLRKRQIDESYEALEDVGRALHTDVLDLSPDEKEEAASAALPIRFQLSRQASNLRRLARRVLEQLAHVESYAVRWRGLSRVHDLRHSLDAMKDCMRESICVLDDVIEYIRERQGRTSLLARQAERYKGHFSRVADTIGKICTGYGDSEWLHMAERSRKGWVVGRIPFDLAVDNPLDCFHAVVYTSATLFINESAEWFRREAGLTTDPYLEKQIESPYRYVEAVRGAVVTSVPAFKFGADDVPRLDAATSVIGIVAEALHGRTLVLCRSRKEMVELKARVERKVKWKGIKVVGQTGDGTSGVEQLRGADGVVLLGVDRYWTGVNVPGDSLSAVIATRLPFPHPRTAEALHRRNHQGKEASREYAKTLTALRLRQGFGRLIRTETDRGIFLVLDARLAGAALGRTVGYLPVELHHLEEDTVAGWLDEARHELRLATPSLYLKPVETQPGGGGKSEHLEDVNPSQDRQVA